ncbi:MAG: hypothetical protein ACFFED_09085 [Candidatus Thorarchaeota archaeon]
MLDLKKWTFGEYVETIRVATRFTIRNYLSFFLALLGVAVVSIVIFLAGTLIVSLHLSMVVGPIDIPFGIFEVIGELITDSTEIGRLGIVLVFIGLLVAPLLIGFGALFGIGQELLESGGTEAEGVLIWFKRKFLSLAGGGIIQFVLLFAPIGLEYIFGTWYFHSDPIGDPVLSLLITLAFIWFILGAGLLSMTFPSIIDGMSIPAALKNSVSLGVRRSDAVFSIWLSFISIEMLLIVPPFIDLVMGSEFLDTLEGSIYALLVLAITVLIILPIHILATSRTYLLISDPNTSEEQVSEPKEEP